MIFPCPFLSEPGLQDPMLMMMPATSLAPAAQARLLAPVYPNSWMVYFMENPTKMDETSMETSNNGDMGISINGGTQNGWCIRM